jgi:hypothetical protein
MRSPLKFIFAIILFFRFSNVQAQNDSMLYQRDSVIEPEADPMVLFFQQNEKVASPAAVKLVTKAGKIVSLRSFLATTGIYADHVLADMDKDGKKELLISNYTGGAHCCDEMYIFKNIAPNRFQHVVKFFAGNTTITRNNEFVYNFYEPFGYFFTCYACSYTDSSDEGPIDIHDIVLNYNKGKIVVVPGNMELRSIIVDNLGKLCEQPYENLADDMAQDNGLRKAVAINLAIFYYSFGRNILETQKLFNRFYKYPDAKKVWTAFTRELQIIKKDSDF